MKIYCKCSTKWIYTKHTVCVPHYIFMYIMYNTTYVLVEFLIHLHPSTHTSASAQWQCGPPLGDLKGMFMDWGPRSYSQCCVGITRSVRSPASWPWKTSLTSANKLGRGHRRVVAALTYLSCTQMQVHSHTEVCYSNKQHSTLWESLDKFIHLNKRIHVE